jgi:hypothetical protein
LDAIKGVVPDEGAVQEHIYQDQRFGRLQDQAALSGVLNILYENQYPVLSVDCLEFG